MAAFFSSASVTPRSALFTTSARIELVYPYDGESLDGCLGILHVLGRYLLC